MFPLLIDMFSLLVVSAMVGHRLYKISTSIQKLLPLDQSPMQSCRSLLTINWWTTKSETINTKQVLWYWHCSPKLLGCHTLTVPPFHQRYTRRGEQTLPVYYQTIPTNGTFFFSMCLQWRSEQDNMSWQCVILIMRLNTQILKVATSGTTTLY